MSVANYIKKISSLGCIIKIFTKQNKKLESIFLHHSYHYKNVNCTIIQCMAQDTHSYG